jgi:HAD superfamily hydrolase (TIGR01484 family)
MSGGDWPQFEAQLVKKLPLDADLSKLFLLPTSGTKLYRYDKGWQLIYADMFDDGERKRILHALDKAVVEAGLSQDRAWGEKIEDRGSQITFSGLGQDAPLDAKQAWDPDFAKRKRMQGILAPLLPDFAVRVGGSTSIDITRQGVDKASGMKRLAGIAGIPTDAFLFMGDAVYPGGNDYPVKEAGIDTIAVHSIGETKRAIEAVIFCLKQ